MMERSASLPVRRGSAPVVPQRERSSLGAPVRERSHTFFFTTASLMLLPPRTNVIAAPGVRPHQKGETPKQACTILQNNVSRGMSQSNYVGLSESWRYAASRPWVFRQP